MRHAVIPEPRGRLAPPSGFVTRFEGRTMGTTWSVQVAGLTPRPEAVRDRVQQALDLVVAQMSQWEPDSEICRYNRAAPGTPVLIGADFAKVMRRALEIAEATGGAFDPALGEAVEAWGFGPSLTPGTLSDDWRPDRWREVRYDGRALLQPGGVHLDLSAIAKGYGVDKVAGAVAELGYDAFLIEIGGEMYGRGLAPDGDPWWAAIEAPRLSLAPQDEILVALPGWALATSGDYRRFYERDGRRLSHTLDPRTGKPVPDAVASVSVLAPDCMSADALATALTVMGEDQGRAFADAQGLAALFLLADGGRIVARPSAAWAELST